MMENLKADLDQEFELLALEVKHCTELVEASQVVGRGLRQFLKNIGLRKRAGRWEPREMKHASDWWNAITQTGSTPDGIFVNNRSVFLPKSRIVSDDQRRKMIEGRREKKHQKTNMKGGEIENAETPDLDHSGPNVDL